MGVMGKDFLMETLSKEFTGPLLFHYVWWVLYHAMERDIRTLCFLARDGYLLREIALQFCKKFDLPIDCRYLYSSRASLRMPTYHFIGDEADESQLQALKGYSIPARVFWEAVIPKSYRGTAVLALWDHRVFAQMETMVVPLECLCVGVAAL